MSTVTHLEQFRLQQQVRPVSRGDSKAALRALWGDAVATVAIVALASTLVFEVLRVLLR
ncbi:MAG TPA: hypothetical protein VHC22_04970 [Pirellulales bacterium]|nr:hypothetical protein [Pirellulales bacterium]